MRCVKLGSPCGGYVQGPESSSDKNGITTRNRILLPNTYSTCLRPNPGTTCFRSEQEKAYFGSWFTKSQGFCEDSLFSIFFVAVSQLALDQNEVLRDIVLALGALTLAPGQQVHTLTPNQQQNIRSGPHYQTALSCYGRALRAMSAMAVSEATVGTILRCCILLICFDLVDGRHQSVHVHIQHGLRILRQYLLSKAGRVDFDLCANAPAPCIVDESMIHLFQRCSSISYVQLGARYSLQHCEMAPSRREGAERSKLLESMLPRKFYTIDEAARWLDLLQNALRSLFLESEASNHGLDDESNRIWEAERSRHVRVLECWAAAFLALERKQVNIGEDEDIAQGEGDRVGLQMMRRIAALKMQYHNAYIFSYTSHYHDYESLVEMEPRFRDIVDLAGTLIGDQSVPEVHTVVPLTISGAILPLFGTYIPRHDVLPLWSTASSCVTDRSNSPISHSDGQQVSRCRRSQIRRRAASPAEQSSRGSVG